MPPVPSLALSSDFRAAVFADSRGVVRLAHSIGLTSYTALSRLLHARRLSGTALTQARMRQLATEINFTGEVFRDR